jgi:hypothetical protein
LDVERLRLLDEPMDGLEDLRAVPVQSQDEAGVHGDAVGLQKIDRRAVAVDLLAFPVPPELDTVEAGSRGAFEADQHLLAAGVRHHRDELWVVGHGDVRLGEPGDGLLSQRLDERPCVASVDEGVVVGELDERLGPELLDRTDLGRDAVDRLDLVSTRQADRAGAEVASPGASSLRLDDEPVPLRRTIDQVEARDRRVGQVELHPSSVVDASELSGFDVLQEPAPDGLALTDDDGVAVLHRLLRRGRHVQTADHGRDAARSVSLREPVGVGSLRRECRDRGEVALGQLDQLRDVVDLVVCDLVSLGRERRDREQREARERLDRAGSVGEPRKRHAELRERLAIGSNAAHRDQRDPHGNSFGRDRSDCRPLDRDAMPGSDPAPSGGLPRSCVGSTQICLGPAGVLECRASIPSRGLLAPGAPRSSARGSTSR